MAALRDSTGKIIGTMDGPGRGSCALFACRKTATDRMRLGCTPTRSLSLDEVMIDREDTEVADSAQARRILAACAGTLDTSDLGTVIEMLVDAGKLNSSEASSLKEKLNPQSMTGVAEDRMFPHRNRLGRDHALAHDGRGASAFVKSLGLDRIKHDPYPARPLGHGDNPNPREGIDAWTKRMFPDSGRLK